MAGAAVLVSRRRVPFLASLLIALSLTGCALGSSEGQAERRAEKGISLVFNTVAGKFSELVFGESTETVTPASLETMARYVLLDAETQHIDGMQRDSTIYDFSSGDGFVRISVFTASAVQVSEGLGGESADRFGCGALVADLNERQVSLEDEECPTWLMGWNGDRAQETSVTTAVRNNGGDGTW